MISHAGIFNPTGYIGGHLRRTNRNLLLWNAVLLLIVLLIVGLMHTYWYCFFRGPFPANDAMLLEAAGHTDSWGLITWVDLRNRTLLPTGWQEVSTSNDVPYERLPYYLMPVGAHGQMMLVQSHVGGEHLIATVYPMPRGTRDEVVAAIVRKHPELKGRILPVMLNAAAAFRVFGYILLPILALISLIAVTNLARVALRTGDPRGHPILRKLGATGLPDAQAARIDMEIAGGSARQFGKAMVLSSMILRPTPFGLQIARIEPTVWAYAINVSGRHCAVLCQRDGKLLSIPLTAATVGEFLTLIAQRVPWALSGYDAARYRQWRKDSSAIIAQAEERRKEYLSESKMKSSM